jgi:hypothetical protein
MACCLVRPVMLVTSCTCSSGGSEIIFLADWAGMSCKEVFESSCWRSTTLCFGHRVWPYLKSRTAANLQPQDPASSRLNWNEELRLRVYAFNVWNVFEPFICIQCMPHQWAYAPSRFSLVFPTHRKVILSCALCNGWIAASSRFNEFMPNSPYFCFFFLSPGLAAILSIVTFIAAAPAWSFWLFHSHLRVARNPVRGYSPLPRQWSHFEEFTAAAMCFCYEDCNLLTHTACVPTSRRETILLPWHKCPAVLMNLCKLRVLTEILRLNNDVPFANLTWWPWLCFFGSSTVFGQASALSSCDATADIREERDSRPITMGLVWHSRMMVEKNTFWEACEVQRIFPPPARVYGGRHRGSLTFIGCLDWETRRPSIGYGRAVPSLHDFRVWGVSTYAVLVSEIGYEASQCSLLCSGEDWEAWILSHGWPKESLIWAWIRSHSEPQVIL